MFLVSIPQSEFCPLGPSEHQVFAYPLRFKFQFLSRNSVRWDCRCGVNKVR